MQTTVELERVISSLDNEINSLRAEANERRLSYYKLLQRTIRQIEPYCKKKDRVLPPEFVSQILSDLKVKFETTFIEYV